MSGVRIPESILNHIGGKDAAAAGGETFVKVDPASGRELCKAARSRAADVEQSVRVAKEAQPAWAALTVVKRGEILRALAQQMQSHRSDLAAIVAAETGKSPADALGETDAALEMGFFVAGEGRRFYGRTTTSATPNRTAMTIRQPLGVAGLIVAANTPIANLAWKAFPALLCGNAAVMKASEDTPATAWAFATLATAAGVPAGVYNTVQGFGPEAGAPLVAHPDVAVVSFTGSCEVGKLIAGVCAQRMTKVCMELGGKNALVVCDDADLDLAVQWTLRSAFTNAGQRCAAGSRILVFSKVYDAFREKLVAAARELRVGPADEDFYGPVINESQLENMIGAIGRAKAAGATILCGGDRLADGAHKGGFYLRPTIIENAGRDAEITRTELFGPITCLYRVESFEDALEFANSSPFALTAAVHTKNIDRAMVFLHGVKTGVASINGGTYGSEPHLPFGGLRQSGNGWREAGTEALDVYSDWKTVYINHDPQAV